MKIRPAALAAALLASLVAAGASAQRMPGRDRGDSPRDLQRRHAEAPSRGAPSAPEPVAALERELPSLKVDLALKAEQVEAWSVFERDVRELAEAERSRRRQLMALRDPDAARPASASSLFATLAEGDRRRADASADLRMHFESLYVRLDEAQRRMVDRRVILSQTEPLGLEPAKSSR